MVQTFELTAYSISINTYERKIVLDTVPLKPSPIFISFVTFYAPLFRLIFHIACTKKGKLVLYAD